MKSEVLAKINRIPLSVAGDVGATTSVISVTNLVVTGPYLGDFQITGGGRLIVGDDPDTGGRGIVSAKGIFGWNTNNVQIFAANFQDYDGRNAGDLHIGNLSSSYLAYKQQEHTLGLYNTQGAGFLVRSDGTLQAGHDTGAHLKWDAADAALRIIVTGSATPIKAEINANGDAYFEGDIRASGGRIYGTMAVDDVLRAGDVDGPAVYLGRFERDTGSTIIRTSELILTDDHNLPWFHAVAGGETLPGYFHLGGSGDYGQYLEYNGTSLVTDGTFISAGGRFRVDSTGLSFTQGANEYLEVKPTSSIFLRLQTTGASDTYNAMRVEENSGIAGYFSGGYVGVYGKSISNQIGVWGYSGTDKAVYGLTDSGVGGTFLATNGGRGVVGSTNSATLAGVVARNTGGGPALVLESSYMDAATQLIKRVADPVAAQDAATRNYVDGKAYNYTVVTKTADYVATATDTVIVCNKATAMTITLPAATGSGKWFAIKSIGAGAVTIDGNSSETIDGATTQVLSQWDAAQIVDYAAGVWAII